jgi:hypothetical protein
MQQMCNPQLFTSFMPWNNLFQHLEIPPMNDCHEFRHAHEIQIKEWQLYWCPNYVSIIRGNVAPSGATTTFGISLINGSENASGKRATKSGGIAKGGGVRPPLVQGVHWPYLT